MSAVAQTDFAGLVPLRATGIELSVGLDRKRVLNGISLDVAQGEVVSLIGSNGAGKSTFLRAFLRLIEPQAGDAWLFGENLRTLRGEKLRRARSQVGFVFQKHNLSPRLTALSNVLHGMQGRSRGPQTWRYAFARESDRREAVEQLRNVGLLDAGLQRADRLSGGQAQRVAIARMLMQRPRIVFADEPTASLDPKAGREVLQLLMRLARERNLPVLFVSHNMEDVVEFSDRIVCLEHGRVVDTMTSKDATPAALKRWFHRHDQ